jgi:hypothetical protein
MSKLLDCLVWKDLLSLAVINRQSEHQAHDSSLTYFKICPELGVDLVGAKSGHIEVGAGRYYSASAESRRRGGLQTLGLARSRRGTCGCKRRARPVSIDFVNA